MRIDTATIDDVLAGRDHDDVAGNTKRLTDAGYDSTKAKTGATLWKMKGAPKSNGKTETDKETAAKIATADELFVSGEGEPFAVVTINGHRENLPIKSSRWRSWLLREFQNAKGKTPSSDALATARDAASAAADIDGDEHEVFTRVGHADGRVYLDLGDPDWRAVEVDAAGWRIVSDPPVRFRRPKGASALPDPVRGGSLDVLRPFVNAPADADWTMLCAWLIGTMAPDGPYPLLALYGEQGSAKSSTTRRLREVIDPARTITRETPKNSRDLLIAAQSCRVLAYDNLSWLNADMSDALCRLATGGGLGTRTLYADADETTFYAKRPIIVNGIAEVATRSDLLSRAIVVQLPRLAVVRDERTLDAEWATAHPVILGALLDATSAALGSLDNVDLGDRAPRMADFARWVEASGAIPGFLDVYAENRDDAVDAALDSDPVATAVIALTTTTDLWEGTAAELRERLGLLPESQSDPRSWPRNAKGMADAVRRVAPALRTRGIEVSDRKTDGRKLWRIRVAPGSQASGLRP